MRLPAEVPERLVPLANGLLEAGLGGPPLEGKALRRMPGDAVEEDAERLRGLEPLRVERLVDEQVLYDQLVARYPRDPLAKRLEALVELVGGSRLRRESPLDRRGAVDRVAGEQQPLGPGRPDPERPERAGRDAPDPRGRIADLGAV